MKFYKGIALALAAAIITVGGGTGAALVVAQPAHAASTQSDIDAAVTQIFNDTNTQRANAGLKPLILAPSSMSNVAQAWTQDMATMGFMSHNPNFQYQLPANWTALGENVANGYTPTTVITAWMASPGHRANILGDYTHIGIGYWVDDAGHTWFTQDFGKYTIPNPSAVSDPANTIHSFDFTSTWTPANGETVADYQVELDSSTGSVLNTITTTQPTATFSGLAASTSYTVKITAREMDSPGLSYYSPVKTFSVTTLADLPTVSAPTNLSLVPTETAINATWVAPTAVYGTLAPYTVTLMQGSTVVQSASTTDTSYTFTGATNNTPYTVNVSANATKGTNTATTTTTGAVTTLASFAATNAPTNLAVNSVTYNSANISWGAPVVISGTVGNYTATLKQSGQPDVTVTTTAPSYNFTGLTQNTSYTVQVAANTVSTDGTKTATTPSASVSLTTSMPFNDIAGNAFVPDITWMKTTGISTGWSDGTYRPYDTVTREAMAAFMYRMAGSPSFTAPTVSPFTDVSTTDPFYKEITWMKTTGISTGWSDGTYRPYDTVTREAMAAFMHRYASTGCSVNISASKTFVDSNTSAFTADIEWMGGTGISTGWGDGTYRPSTTTTREAMAAFMHRLSDLINANGGCK
jgi:hypothetical protein